MRPFVVLLLSLVLASPSFAVGIEDLAVYKEHPENRDILKIYWERLLRAQAVSKESGGQIATELVLADSEIQLVQRGFSEIEFAKLRELARSSRTSEELLAQERVSQNKLNVFLDNIDVAPREYISQWAREFFKEDERYLKFFEAMNWFSSSWARPEGLKPGNGEDPDEDLAFRFFTGFLILSLIQERGGDLSSPTGQRSMNGTLRVLKMISENKYFDVGFQGPFSLASFGKSLKELGLSPEFGKNMMRYWKSRNPAEINKVARETLSKLSATKLTHDAILGVFGSLGLAGTILSFSHNDLTLHQYVGLALGAAAASVFANFLFRFRREFISRPRALGLRSLQICQGRMGGLWKR